MTFNPQPKDVFVRDKKYRQWIATKPCAACGLVATEEYLNVPAHQRDLGPCGGSLKPGDVWVLPLCHKCHQSEHRGNFWGNRPHINRYELIIALITEYYVK